MKRQVQIVLMDEENPETNQAYTDDELAQIATQCLETGTSPFLQGLAQNALEDVLRKHEAIVQIERNVNEVAQMFQDLALLVESQGEQLDRIEANVRPRFRLSSLRSVLTLTLRPRRLSVVADHENVREHEGGGGRAEEGERVRHQEAQEDVLPLVGPRGRGGGDPGPNDHEHAAGRMRLRMRRCRRPPSSFAGGGRTRAFPPLCLPFRPFLSCAPLSSPPGAHRYA